MNFDVACPMNFHKFPWDEQICKVKFESFSYSKDQLTMKWMNETLSQVKQNILLTHVLHRIFRLILTFILISSSTK